MNKNLRVNLKNLKFESLYEITKRENPKGIENPFMISNGKSIKKAEVSLKDVKGDTIEQFFLIQTPFMLEAKYMNVEEKYYWQGRLYFERYLSISKIKFYIRKLSSMIKDPLDPIEYKKYGFVVEEDFDFELE